MEQDSYQMGATVSTALEGELSVVPFLEAASPSMRAVEAVIRELAHSSVPVLLVGEHGTGKKALAWRIHQNSDGGSGPFRVKACKALGANALNLDQLPSGATLYLEE